MLIIPYYRKLTLYEIKVLEINMTQINANLMENDFQIKEIKVRERIAFWNEGNYKETKLVETSGTKKNI